MAKLIDFDGMFDRQLTRYMKENAGKYAEKEWERMIPGLYEKFGDTFVKSADDTPRGYYKKMDDKTLVETLVRHVEEGVPISDFLCRELESRDCPDELVALLGSGNEEILTLAVNLAGSNRKALPALLDIVAGDYDKEIRDAAADMLKAGADEVSDRVLSLYEQGVATEYMLEILSRCKKRDEKIYSVLLSAFRTSGEGEIPMRASYLAAYGDERALPVLLEFIDRDEINYLEFQELRYAIEALGGEYTRERDFSEDAYYKEIMEQSALPPDFDPVKKAD